MLVSTKFTRVWMNCHTHFLVLEVSMNTRSLRTALLVNAFFSAVCALLMLFGSGSVETLLGIQAPVLIRLVGFGLLLFASDLIHQATRPRLETWRALYASVADLLWVIGSVLGLLFFSGLLSATGVAVVLAIAGVVLILGLWQMWGIDRAHRAENLTLHRHCLVVRTEVPAANMWEVIRPMGDIQNYAPSLAKSEILDDEAPGVGAVRRCTGRSGRCWEEECVDFDPGHCSFTLRFVSEAPDFPFPVSTMIGGWKVLSAGTGSDVMVWWELTPKPRFLAPILLPILAFSIDRDLVQIVRRMADDALTQTATSHSLAQKQARAWLVPTFC